MQSPLRAEKVGNVCETFSNTVSFLTCFGRTPFLDHKTGPRSIGCDRPSSESPFKRDQAREFNPYGLRAGTIKTMAGNTRSKVMFKYYWELILIYRVNWMGHNQMYYSIKPLFTVVHLTHRPIAPWNFPQFKRNLCLSSHYSTFCQQSQCVTFHKFCVILHLSQTKSRGKVWSLSGRGIKIMRDNIYIRLKRKRQSTRK